MSTEACRRYLVSGRVQGVFFRASTASRAKELSLRGHAINLPDGRVEVVAAGSEESLKILHRWLWDGPPAADVTAVETMDHDEDPAPGFRTG